MQGGPQCQFWVCPTMAYKVHLLLCISEEPLRMPSIWCALEYGDHNLRKLRCSHAAFTNTISPDVSPRDPTQCPRMFRICPAHATHMSRTCYVQRTEKTVRTRDDPSTHTRGHTHIYAYIGHTGPRAALWAAARNNCSTAARPSAFGIAE